MKIVRFVDSAGRVRIGRFHDDERAEILDGDFFETLTPTGTFMNIVELLAPVVPTQILGIGLNYRRHAAEAGASPPEQPVLFVKGNNTLQHPRAPIALPRYLRS